MIYSIKALVHRVTKNTNCHNNITSQGRWSYGTHYHEWTRSTRKILPPHIISVGDYCFVSFGEKEASGPIIPLIPILIFSGYPFKAKKLLVSIS